MADTAVDASKASEDPPHSPHKEKFWALALGSIGVVFGDIGTSPLYAMREALAHSKGGGGGELAVLGVKYETKPDGRTILHLTLVKP